MNIIRERSNLELNGCMHLKSGFTLVEMMVVLGIIAMMAVIGLPGLQTMVANARIRSAATQLASDLMYARTEAIRSRANIQVCPANDQTPPTGCATGTDWKTNGWVVGPSTAFNVIRHSARLKDPVRLELSREGGVPNAIEFLPSGFPAANSREVVFRINAATKATASCREIILRPSGQIDVTQPSDCSFSLPS